MKFSVEKLEEMGFKLAMYSTAAVLAVQHALFEVYTTIRKDGNTEKMRERMTTFAEYRALVDEDLWNEMHNINAFTLKKVETVDSADSQISGSPLCSSPLTLALGNLSVANSPVSRGCSSPSSTSRYHM